MGCGIHRSLAGAVDRLRTVAGLGGGATLIAALPLTDEIGFALGALVVGWHLWRNRPTVAHEA